MIPRHRARNARRLDTHTVYAAPFSIASTKGIYLPPGTKMFQFPGCPPPGLCVQPGVLEHYLERVAPFRNRRIIVCSNSPTLIAGRRVFLRLLVPRHPPRTLTSLFDL